MPSSDSNLRLTLDTLQRIRVHGKALDGRATGSGTLLRDLIYLAVVDVFSESFYTARYRDIAQGIKDGHFACGLEHYLEVGIYEGRMPLDIPLDEVAYLAKNPDVEAAIRRGEYCSAKDHFISIGFVEGRGYSLRHCSAVLEKTDAVSAFQWPHNAG